MTLQQQLEYNWERGFYSVVKTEKGNYVIFSTKNHEGELRCSLVSQTKEGAINTIGIEGSVAFATADVNLSGWKIVDTIHPSELMGKGFQVGDKVEVAGGIYNLVEINGPTVVIRNNTSVRDITTDYNHLKPVLPVEEKNLCMKCGVHVSKNDIGVIRTGSDYFCCYSCDKEVNKVVELLKKARIIKDGNIINL